MGAIADFFKDPFNKGLVAVLCVVALLLFLWPSSAIDSEADITMFTLDTCPYCQMQKAFHQELLKERPEITIDEVDVSTQTGQAYYRQLLTKLGEPPESVRVPVTVIGDTIIRGFSPDTTPQQIRAALDNQEVSVVDSTPEPITLFGKEIRPAEYSLFALAVLLGAADGFNPCAMWVLVYLISLVVALRDRRRAWLLVGIFLLASGILYFLFMTAWLNVFLVVGFMRPVQILIGLLAIGIGVSQLRVATKNSVECKVGDIESKKKTKRRIHELINSPLTWLSLLGIIALAFTVNALEFACSMGIPAVFTQVLATSGISLAEQYGYIALYVLMFMLDDLLIFSIAVFAVRSSIGEKYARWAALISGVILLLLGLLLAFFPGVIASLM